MGRNVGAETLLKAESKSVTGPHSLVVSPHSIVVSLPTVGQRVLGFNPISHVGFFSPDQLLPRAGNAMGPIGRLGPHIHVTDASLRVLF